mmetsp:Transcript_18228/g.42443  ORF Transcript_18228/g.42443 Transcript_18228/m.42443 type:complete len:1739 (+) Transcript_18228:144-5360(+)
MQAQERPDDDEDDLASEGTGVSGALMPRMPESHQMHPPLDSQGEVEAAAAEQAMDELANPALEPAAREEGEFPASEDTGATPRELQWRDHGGPPMSPIAAESTQDQSRRFSLTSQPSLEEVHTPPDDLLPLEPELEAVLPPVDAPPPLVLAAPPPMMPPPSLPMTGAAGGVYAEQRSTGPLDGRHTGSVGSEDMADRRVSQGSTATFEPPKEAAEAMQNLTAALQDTEIIGEASVVEATQLIGDGSELEASQFEAPEAEEAPSFADGIMNEGEQEAEDAPLLQHRGGASSGTSSPSHQRREVYATGQMAEIAGLLNETQYNGCKCIIESCEADGNYVVRIVDEGDAAAFTLKLRGDHLIVTPVDAEKPLHEEAGGDVAVPMGSAEPEPMGEPEAESEDDHAEEGMKEAFSRVSFNRQQSGVRQGILDAFAKYTRLVVRWPCGFIVFYAILVIACCAALWRPIDLDEDLSSFVRADGDAMRNRDAFSLALEEQNTDDASRRLKEIPENGTFGDSVSEEQRRLQQTFGSPEWFKRELVLVYEAKDGNILDERALRDIQHFELRLRDLPEFQELCQQHVTGVADKWGCDPGESLAAFVWPTQLPGNASNHERSLLWDGRGKEALQMPVVIAYLETAYGNGMRSRDLYRFLPSSFEEGNIYEATPRYADRAKTSFTFVLTYSYSSWTATESKNGMSAMKEKYEKAVTGPIYDFLTENVDSYEYIRIYYSGDVILSHETTEALKSDIMWAIGSLLYVTCYIYVHNRSLLLSLGSFFIIFTSVPLAYVMVPAAKTTFASLMSVFLITVIDIDIIFVFNDFWEQSVTYRSLEMRLAWMLLRAGKSCLATSLTTSVSFFANLASALQPLREFGLFMGMCVMNVYILALLFLPPLVALQEKMKGRSNGLSSKVAASAGSDSEAEEPLVGEAKPKKKKGMLPECCRKKPKKKPHEERTYLVLSALVEAISRFPSLVVFLTLGLVAMFVWGMITGFELDTSLPEIFPPDHNQVAGKEALGDFSTMTVFTELPQRTNRNDGAFCDPRGRHPGANDTSTLSCLMHWCHADASLEGPLDQVALAGAESQSLEGSCFRSPTRRLDDATNAYEREMGFGWDVCNAVQVGSRFAITGNAVRLPSTEELATTWTEMIHSTFNTSVLSPESFFTSNSDPLVIEEWETGEVAVTRLLTGSSTEARWGTERLLDAGLTLCEVDIFCFISVKACEFPDWMKFYNFNMSIGLATAGTVVPGQTPIPSPVTATPAPPPVTPAPQRLLRPGATQLPNTLHASWFLQPGASKPVSRKSLGRRTQVAADDQIDVDVVYGIRPLKSTPVVGAPDELWSYDPNFEPDNPWAQRGMMAMCEEAINWQDPFELWVMDYSCWIMDFKRWLEVRGSRFPTRDFQREVSIWYSSNDEHEANMWFEDGLVKAAKMTFWVDVATDTEADSALDYMKFWDTFISHINVETSVTANSAFHTAQKWVQAEAQVAIVSSTIDTVIIESGVSWFGILLFTGDPMLALLVLVLILGNICGLAFFMITIMDWTIGPIEVIFIVVFLGFSVTYGLHTSHNYSAARSNDAAVIFNEKLAWRRRHRKDAHDEKKCATEVRMALKKNKGVRKARTRSAILEVGGAIMSSTISTVGSSLFLLFCTLNIFISLGCVVIAVTTLSILFTLISLPAVLMLFGPGPDPWYKKYPKKAVKALLGGKQKATSKDDGSPRQPFVEPEGAREEEFEEAAEAPTSVVAEDEEEEE